MFLITGGGSGIGQALALSLAQRGQEVLIVGRREQLLQDTAAAHANIHSLRADITSREGLETIKSYLRDIPSLSGLVNNAGILKPITLLKDISPIEWQKVINTNLNAPLYLSQMLYDKLSNGRILNIGSGAAYFPMKGWGPYCVTKAALAMMSRCWQVESQSVAFASVMPGIIDTEMQDLARSGANLDKESAHFYKRLKDHGRLLSPETVAVFLTWLLLDVERDVYVLKEWDIYETYHHMAWLKPPHQVLHWDF